MGNISVKKMRSFYKIFEQIYEEPLMTIHDIAENVDVARNTVSKYLKYMYEHKIIVGPQLCVNSAVNCAEYVYLMNFEHPFETFKGLKGFPHVLYNAVTFGDWNTMVITDKQLDFPQLVGFQGMVHQRMKGFIHTPKSVFSTWDNSFKKVYDYTDQFTPEWTKYKDQQISVLPWGENEWMLYHTFKSCMRKKVTPALREINMLYEHYTKWKKSLQDHCTVPTGFYPDGYESIYIPAA